jgi:hypothetical protein
MARRHTGRDLLGKPIRNGRPRFEVALERADMKSIPERAERIRWLAGVIPEQSFLGMPLESLLVFQEAKNCFIYGQPVASIVLASAFVEHWLGDIIGAKGFQSEATMGLDAITKCCTKNAVLPQAIIDRIDNLRRIRNPFVHIKAFEHPHGIVQRMRRTNTHPTSILEADARDALITMYSVVRYAK